MKNILLALFLIVASAASAQVVTPQEQPAQPVPQEPQPVVQPAAQPTVQPVATVTKNDSLIVTGDSLVQPIKRRYGYLNYRAVFEAMPEYASAKRSLADIKSKYDAEAVHNEEEFRRMYLDFLQGQKDFPQNIMLKRQKELQNAMERGIKFRTEVSKMLDSAQKDLEAPIFAKLDNAIRLVATEKGYEYVMNTDAHAFPFIEPTLAEDITQLVLQKLQDAQNSK